MQNAKDSFYLALRTRLATVNPSRQLTIAGIARPGILVEANETMTPMPPRDVFVLRWGAVSLNGQMPSRMEEMDCEIFYCTEGSAMNEQMDRGRALTAMDAELWQMLQPQNAQKQSVGTQNTVPMATNIFWSSPAYAKAQTSGTLMSRTVTVRVFALQELLQTGGLEA